METKKIKEFGKKHWRKAAAIAGGLIVVGAACVAGKKVHSGEWHPVSTEGLSNVGWANKWSGKDEFNGCIAANLQDVTMDELCETGKQLLAKGELADDTKIKAVTFITEGIK